VKAEPPREEEDGIVRTRQAKMLRHSSVTSLYCVLCNVTEFEKAQEATINSVDATDIGPPGRHDDDCAFIRLGIVTGADTAFRLAQVIDDIFWAMVSRLGMCQAPCPRFPPAPPEQSWDGKPMTGGLRAGTLRDFINHQG